MYPNPINPPKNPGKITQWAAKKVDRENIFISGCKTMVRVLLIFSHEFKQTDLTLRSAALTYTILLSLVPMLAMSTAIVKGIGGGDQLKDLVYGYVNTLEHNTKQPPLAERDKNILVATEGLPAGHPEKIIKTHDEKNLHAANLTSQLRSAIDQVFAYVDRTNFAALGTFGVIGIILTIILVLSNIEASMNSIWHAESGRSLIRKVTDYLTLLILFPISINVGFASNAIVKNQALSNKLDAIMPVLWIQAFLFKLLPVFIIGITLYIMYLFFPNTRVKTFPALAGAFLASFFWFATQNVYITLQIGVSNYNAIYGSFAMFPLFLLWIYLGWLFILLGAQAGYAIQNRNSYPLVSPDHTPLQTVSAALDILDTVYASQQNGQQATIESLFDELHSHGNETIDHALAILIKEEIICKTGDEKEKLLPFIPRELVNKREIIEAVLGKNELASPQKEECEELFSPLFERNCPAAPPETETEEKEEGETREKTDFSST